MSMQNESFERAACSITRSYANSYISKSFYSVKSQAEHMHTDISAIERFLPLLYDGMFLSFFSEPYFFTAL